MMDGLFTEAEMRSCLSTLAVIHETAGSFAPRMKVSFLKWCLRNRDEIHGAADDTCCSDGWVYDTDGSVPSTKPCVSHNRMKYERWKIGHMDCVPSPISRLFDCRVCQQIVDTFGEKPTAARMEKGW